MYFSYFSVIVKKRGKKSWINIGMEFVKYFTINAEVCRNGNSGDE
jgi:hypothetical protein